MGAWAETPRFCLLNLREQGQNRHADGVPASITTDADTLIPVRIAGLRHANVVCTTLIESRQMTATISSAHRKCIGLGVRAEGNYGGWARGGTPSWAWLRHKNSRGTFNHNIDGWTKYCAPV